MNRLCVLFSLGAFLMGTMGWGAVAVDGPIFGISPVYADDDDKKKPKKPKKPKQPKHQALQDEFSAQHDMIKETLDVVEGNQAKTHEWLEKIETAIEELADPLCGAGTEGQRFVPDDPTNPTEYCDNDTGLFWVKTPDSILRNHADALTHCAELNLGNGQTYRLPEVKELISLVDYSQFFPALPAGHPFMNIQNGSFWSATPLVTSSSNLWEVDFAKGFVDNLNKSLTNSVWCARSGS